MLHQVVCGPGARAHQLREARQHRRMLDEQGEIGAAPADRLEQRQKATEHRLRGWRGAPRRAAIAEPGRRSVNGKRSATAGSGGLCRTRASSLDQRARIAIACGGKRSQLGLLGRRRDPDSRQRIRSSRHRRWSRRARRNGGRHCSRCTSSRRSNPAASAHPIASASAALSSSSWGRSCVCASSRYCSRCSTLRRNT